METSNKIIGAGMAVVCAFALGLKVADQINQSNNVLIPFNREATVGITKSELAETLRKNANSIIQSKREEVIALCDQNAPVMKAQGVDCQELLSAPTGP